MWVYIGVIAASVAFFCILGVIAYALFQSRTKITKKHANIIEFLPNTNCGKCSCLGCAYFAEALTTGEHQVEDCPFLSFAKAQKIRAILNQKYVSPTSVAFVFCKGGDLCKNKFDYFGANSCKEQSKVHDGRKQCAFGCMGCGDCANICPNGAISINKRGVAVVDKERCISCGSCVDACPKSLIRMIPYDQKVSVVCNNSQITSALGELCSVSCSHCDVCMRVCPAHAIDNTTGIPIINGKKCTGCLTCLRSCPRNCISRIK